MPDTVDRRYRSFDFDGFLVHLVEDPEVRERDLRENTLTMWFEGEGQTRVILPEDVQKYPPLPGQPVVAEEDKYGLRSLIETLLGLEFDDHWIHTVVFSALRHDMFKGSRP
ncbi:MAG: hypothetical protein CMJ83_18600 [Planctomycetes bacterium]|nr:hypothetical protein [Planctomycetota bacterium]